MRNPDRKQHPGRVEDYTAAFLATCAVLFFMGFWVIAALFGFFWMVTTAAVIDLAIKQIARRR